MAATAIIVGTAGYFASKSGQRQAQKDLSGTQAGMQAQQAALTPPVIPPPPTTASGAAAGSDAMTQAANRYRRQQGAGISSTILTSPSGAGSAPTSRKTLLGL